MPWVRFDDQYPIHRKVAALSDPAYRLHSASIPWSNRNLMDGWIPTGDLDQVCAQVRKPATFVLELVRRGLFHEAGHNCPSTACPADGTHADGWVIHDYWNYQPSRAKVVQQRRAKAERQARWLAKRIGASSTGPADLSTTGMSGNARDGPKKDADIDASNDTSHDTSVTPTPPRPAPKEAVAGHRSTARRQRAGGAAGGEPNVRTSPTCPRCGNPTSSAYHRNVCAKQTP
jgi:hypothetical protein